MVLVYFASQVQFCFEPGQQEERKCEPLTLLSHLKHSQKMMGPCKFVETMSQLPVWVKNPHQKPDLTLPYSHRNELLYTSHRASIHQHRGWEREGRHGHVMFSQAGTECPLSNSLLWNVADEHPCQENIAPWSSSFNKTQFHGLLSALLSIPPPFSLRCPREEWITMEASDHSASKLVFHCLGGALLQFANICWVSVRARGHSCTHAHWSNTLQTCIYMMSY